MKRVIHLFIFLLFALSGFAQVQYQQHKQFINPSAMGAETVLNFATYAQLRLHGFDSAPIETGLQITIPFSTVTKNQYGLSETSGKNMYIGLNAFMRTIGVNSNYAFLASYGYKINFSHAGSLTFALALGTDINSINYQKLLHEYDNDPLITSLSVPTKYTLHAQAGVYLQSKNFYLSLYSPDLASKQSIYLQSGFFTQLGQAGDDYFEEDTERKSSFEINTQIGYTNSDLVIHANTLFTLNNLLGIGAAWQYPYQIAALVKLNFGAFSVGYSYQIDNFDKYLPTHEIMLKVRINPKSGDGF